MTRLGLWPLAAIPIGWITVIWLWADAPLTLPPDDAFYYLRVAQHIAAGNGVTFDGVQPTNGFHPLWQATLAALVRLVPAGTETLVRVALSLQVLLASGGTLLLSRRLGRAARPFLALSAVAALNFYLTFVVVNGMESALQLALLCATLFVRGDPSPRAVRQPLLLGSLAAFTTLARLEAAVFSLLAILLPAQAVEAPRRTRMIALVPLALAGAGYSLWSLMQFGYPLPISGVIKVTTPVVSLPDRVLVGLALVLGLAGCVWASYRWRRETRARELVLLLPLAGHVMFLQAFTMGVRGHRLSESWTLVPHLLLALTGAALLLTYLPPRRWVRWGFALAAGGHLVFAGVTWRYRLDPASYAHALAARRTGEWLRDHTPADSRIAGWDCGVIAAFAERRFTNLEGLMGSFEFKRSWLDRGRIEAYLDQAGVEYLAQSVSPVLLALPSEARQWDNVRLSPWTVERAECVRVASFRHPERDNRVMHVILSRRPGGILFADLRPGAWCD